MGAKFDIKAANANKVLDERALSRLSQNFGKSSSLKFLFGTSMGLHDSHLSDLFILDIDFLKAIILLRCQGGVEFRHSARNEVDAIRLLAFTSSGYSVPDKSQALRSMRGCLDFGPSIGLETTLHKKLINFFCCVLCSQRAS